MHKHCFALISLFQFLLYAGNTFSQSALDRYSVDEVQLDPIALNKLADSGLGRGHLHCDVNGLTNKDCQEFSNVNFDSGWKIWNDGGNDCSIRDYGNNNNSGSKSVRLRDNSGSKSSIYTDNIDFSSFTEVIVNFSFVAESMEYEEDLFLEASTNGGSEYYVIKKWSSGVEFANGVKQHPSVTISSDNLSSNTVIRIRCDASTNSDRIMIDDVVIETCGRKSSGSEALAVTKTSSAAKAEKDIDLNFHPNPVYEFLNVELSGYADEKISKIEFATTFGTKLKTVENVNDYNCRLNLNELDPGQSYLMILTTESSEVLVEKFFKV